MSTIVDRMFDDFQQLLAYLDQVNEVSFRSIVEDNFRKSLLLAAASYFERRICDDLLAFFNESANGNLLVVEFTRNKSISRQYHTYFNWRDSNANQFFGLFGKNFIAYMKAELSQDAELEAGMRAFMEIGRERNRMVHEDFGTFTLEKTAEEIYTTFQKALKFVEVLPVKFRSSVNAQDSAA